MQFKVLALIRSSIVGSSVALLPILPSVAQTTDIRFECDETYNNGQPALVARTPDGIEPVILWVQPLGGFSPEQRCELAAINFQKYMVQQGMDEIKVVNQNGSPAMYAVSSTEPEKRGYLYTASSWDNIENARRSLGNSAFYRSTPIEQGGQESFSFNLLSYLRSNSESSNTEFPLPQ
ncbi:MAG: hypothetical protein HC827_12545 [Cyanobacteria bacterium RM1_2_2]|nr:hypothetical protein [Cyanobacteria bacterium RM1_2_2]